VPKRIPVVGLLQRPAQRDVAAAAHIMRILLASSQGYGCHFLLRLMREGHACEWVIIDESEEKYLKNILKGIIPRPLEKSPKFKNYDLVIFDSTGHGELADEARKDVAVIGDSVTASRLEDDRLFGLETMEQCDIEVPEYTVCGDPDEAREFLKENPNQYVFKPFEPEDPDLHQESDATYVSESAEDMLRCIDKLYARALEQPFILQEVVEGVECATNAWFDGQNFHFLTHTIEEKKFMSGCRGPNTGCAGNLIINPRGAKRLATAGLLKLVPFLRDVGYRGPLDLNMIVSEHHTWGLEFTPRFGYDSSPTEFAMFDGNLGEFLLQIATGPVSADPMSPLPYDYAAAARYSIPPYPTEIEGKHPRGVPIKGVPLDDAWKSFYLYDAMESDGELVTAGITGFVGCPIGRGHTPQAAWEAVARLAEDFCVPNCQVRDDLRDATIKRLCQVTELGWL
jgi:phosphoribosylamine---glycine ligase